MSVHFWFIRKDPDLDLISLTIVRLEMESDIGSDVWFPIRRYSSPLTKRIINLVCKQFWDTRRYSRKDYSCAALALQEDEKHLFYYFLDCKVDWLTYTEACRLGNLELLERLLPRKEELDQKYYRLLWKTAIEEGHLHVLHWLHKYFLYSMSSSLLVAAVERGNLQIVEWLHQTFSNPDANGIQTKWHYGRKHSV